MPNDNLQQKHQHTGARKRLSRHNGLVGTLQGAQAQPNPRDRNSRSNTAAAVWQDQLTRACQRSKAQQATWLTGTTASFDYITGLNESCQQLHPPDQGALVAWELPRQQHRVAACVWWHRLGSLTGVHAQDGHHSLNRILQTYSSRSPLSIMPLSP